MIVALDVAYVDVAGGEVGVSGVVGFDDWKNAEATFEGTTLTENIKPYVSGRLFERELPCLMDGLRHFEATHPGGVDVVVVDGNVRLDQHGAPGLGMFLFDELGGSVPVIGVAKNSFEGLAAREVTRGESQRPLFVTAAGINEQTAAKHIESMAGQYRMPTLLTRADQLSRTPRH